MANITDDNDLGPQVIEGTEPPIILDAVPITPSDDGAVNAVVSDEPIVPPPAEDAAIPVADEVITTPVQADEPIIVTPVPTDDQTVIAAQASEQTPPVFMPTDAELNAQLAAILNDDTEPVVTVPPAAAEHAPDPQAEVQEQIGQFLDDQLNRILDEENTEQRAQAVAQEQIGKYLDDELDRILTDQLIEEKEKAAEEKAQSMVEQARLIMEQAQAAQDALQKAQAEPAPAPTQQPDAATEAAKAMMEQARLMMEQAQQAQIAAAQQAQAVAAQAAAKPEYQSDAATEAAKAMMEQARLMMEQAQQAQIAAAQQAQAVAAQAAAKSEPQSDAATEAAKAMMEQARLMMQQAQEASIRAHSTASKPDDGARGTAEVDKLRNEIDGLRDLLNKLTVSMAQTQNGVVGNGMNAQQIIPPYYGDAGDRFRKLQDELELMRRDLAEKDLKDRERELERKQKEAETVKDIRPEMIQMSDPETLPGTVQNGGGNGAFGQEYIALADGVFYSTKDKQIYVMTPASKAVVPSGLTPAKKTVVTRPAAKPVAKPANKPKRKAAKKRSPSGASAHGAHRARPGHAPHRRPSRPTHR